MAQPSLALRLLMSISVTHASWGATCVYPFLLLLLMRLISLISFTDLWTSPVPSISGYKYYLVVLDDFSHYSWTFPLRSKSKAFSTISHFFAWVSTQFGLTIKVVQCDNGREFDNNTSRSFFLYRGVQLRMSCPYTSTQNGKAERMIRTTNDVMRTLLFQASLPARFWAESLHTATYFLNRLPSTASPAPTPHHAFFCTPPRYDHLRVFGCSCYPNTSATAPHKLAPRSTRCVFLGYSPDHKGYRCFDLTSRRVLISRHVVFDDLQSTLTSEDVQKCLVPTSVKELRSLLGLAGYYRRFVRNFGVIAKPLTNLLKKGVMFVWTHETEQAFQALKQALLTTPVLAIPDFQQTFTVVTDASDKGIGAVALSLNQQSSSYEKESLAILMAIDHWRSYLQPAEFIIKTDHRSLVSLDEQRLHTHWQHKVMTKLMGLQYKICYKTGSSNIAADALSRLPHPAEGSLAAISFSLNQGAIKYKDRIWLGHYQSLQVKVMQALHAGAIGGHSGVFVT
ncbi:hypothetical protein U9M48_029863 [Paspalum notatum var. saurae]|uniref:Integrase catalytic domain-containing protein n=1 Tax=Paspalum notatum var. saurae TaxID=547442 RepID=A0AAQ3X354_PASNO